MNDKPKVVWADRWLSGGTPESRFNVPVSYVEDSPATLPCGCPDEPMTMIRHVRGCRREDDE